ncbi:uncharacterized protein LOC131240729 [Magnolia sinica]|uniref:uncharacterized protein LOC131240729 n=1 Tax=Magnolia sinica TaxID=86752 RepID=UPI00265A19AD|nr:uncharacterized protein LOC131240729 [Magnolia sinica]
MGWCNTNVPYTPVVPMHSCTKRTAQVLWSTNHLQLLLQRRGVQALVHSHKLQAINGSYSLFIALKSPASSGDYSAFLPISAVLFFIYWIANFVVPDMISKDFESEKPSEKQTLEELIASQAEKGNKPDGIDSSGRTRKRNARKKSSKL